MILKNGEHWEPTAHMVSMWKEVYLKINVENELAKAALWLEANPARRKTRSGIQRFCQNWLGRAKPEITSNSTRRRSIEEDLTDRSWAE